MKTEKRLDNYLSDYNFQRNNIEFRIVSSKALETFKNVQSFQLGQLVNGKFYFSEKRREILLLQYELVSKFLIEVEHLIIDKHGDETIDKPIIKKLLELTDEKMNEVIYKNSSCFDMCFVSLWYQIHNLSFEYFIKLVDNINTNEPERYFVELVDIAIMFMEHTLIEIHELNNIMRIDCGQCEHPQDCNFASENCSNDIKCIPTMYITDLSIRHFYDNQCTMVTQRIQKIQEVLGFDTIRIKNHSNSQLPDTFLNVIESYVNVDYKGSLKDEL